MLVTEENQKEYRKQKAQLSQITGYGRSMNATRQKAPGLVNSTGQK